MTEMVTDNSYLFIPEDQQLLYDDASARIREYDGPPTDEAFRDWIRSFLLRQVAYCGILVDKIIEIEFKDCNGQPHIRIRRYNKSIWNGIWSVFRTNQPNYHEEGFPLQENLYQEVCALVF